MANYTRMTAEDIVAGGRSPTVAIFGDLSKWERRQIRGISIILGTDFEDAPFLTTASQSGKIYSIFEGTCGGLTTANDVGKELGVLSMATGATDNMENYIQIGYGNPLLIDDNNTGNTGVVLFEARIAPGSIANNSTALFVGLGTGPVAANYLVDDTGVLKTDTGFIGFQRLQDDGGNFDIIYQAASQTKVTLVANAVAAVAGTYLKLGLKYDPDAAAAKRIKFYIDGVEQSTYVTATQINAADFPEGEALVPMVLQKNGAAGAETDLVDWVHAVQDLDG